MIIHTECLPDEALVTSFGIDKKSVYHHRNINKVLAYLYESTDLIAMIDEDPGKSKASYHKLLVEIESKHRIKILEDKKRRHTVIMLCPDLEPWLIQCCKNAKINMQDYNLPDKPSELHEIINTRLDKISLLVKTMLEKKSPEILFLKKHLTAK